MLQAQSFRRTNATGNAGNIESERSPLVAAEQPPELDDDFTSVLPFQNSPVKDDTAQNLNWFRSSAFGSEHLLVLGQLIYGIFLASCPIPRFYLSQFIRVVLIAHAAIWVTSALSRRGTQNKSGNWRRLLIAYLGFYLSIYAIFGAADEVHLDLRWTSLLWNTTHEGFQVGYLSRCLCIFIGYCIQRSAGIHSRTRILGSYLLSLFWVYADTTTTIIDHARGREYW